MKQTLIALVALLAALAVFGAAPAAAQSDIGEEQVEFSGGDDVANISVDVEFSEAGNVTLYPVSPINQTVYFNTSGTIQEIDFSTGDIIPATGGNETLSATTTEFDEYQLTVWKSGQIQITPEDSNLVNGTYKINISADTTNPDGSNDTAAIETFSASKSDESNPGLIGGISSTSRERMLGFAAVVAIIALGYRRGYFE